MNMLNHVDPIQILIGIIIVIIVVVLSIKVARKLRFLVIIGIYLIANGFLDLNIFNNVINQMKTLLGVG